jgi:hypothetical protein
MSVGVPAWLELRWETPISIGEVQLIFDTGLHRFLTLSQADGYTRRMHWGAPQPETIADYRLEYRDGDEWRVAMEIRGNYQRRRVHRFTSVTTEALRIVVLRTHGLDHARICEVRIYA